MEFLTTRKPSCLNFNHGTLIVLLIIILASVIRNVRPIDDFQYDGGKCVVISEPVCKGPDVRYNVTHMPNMVGISSQKDAGERMASYHMLIQTNCSRFLKMFLCTVYFPLCSGNSGADTPSIVMKPCKSECLYMKRRCGGILKGAGYAWPEELDCEKFQQTEICIKHPKNAKDTTPLKDPNKFKEKFGKFYQKDTNPGSIDLEDHNSNPQTHNMIGTDSKSNTKCSSAEITIAYDNNGTCRTKCNANLMFRGSDKRFAEIWMTVWATLCCISTGLTILTFVTDSSRFRYPERPIIYLTTCYFFYSLAFLIRAGLGPERIACRQLKPGKSFLITAGNEGTWCTIIFLIMYFFGMASALWWVMLTMTWFLSAARKWGYEGVEAISSVFHMVAWALPAVKTIIILIMHKIDADELTGMCLVGNQDSQSLLLFVIIPLALYLAAGGIFLAFGFLSLLGVHQDLKKEGGNSNVRRLEKLMVKIAIFSILYCVPVMSVLGSYFYEFISMKKWKQKFVEMSPKLREKCLLRQGLNWASKSCLKDVPASEVYMLKIFMSLVVGITSGMWVWCNKKTWKSWTESFQRRFGKRPDKLVLMGNQQEANQFGWRQPPVGNSVQGGPLVAGSVGMGTYHPPSYATLGGKSLGDKKYVNSSCV